QQKKNQQLARFERETKLCSEIKHPNIVQLIDKGYLDNGEPYAVFEYIEGETLKKFILRTNGLPAPKMAALMEQVLDALVSAHSKGIVHRDLKPHNIMVSKMGSRHHIKILDFGIGAFTHDFRSLDYQNLTVTQDVLGTPTYSAPEQLRGEPPTVKSDLYAWGLIVLECLTGRPVMDGGSIAEVFQRQLMSSRIPLPQAIVGHDLAKLLRRVLEKNSRDRVGDVQTIFKEFEQINFNTLIGDITVQKKEIASYEEITVGNDMIWSGISGSRKQLTILCLKLNLEIANNMFLDLEILDTIQKDQVNLCKDTAIHYGGHVSGAFMNNLAIYFGYPESNDTDARRAGRTALELINDVKKRSALLYEQYSVSLSIQIGLHTGIVLVQRNNTPEGNVPNMAFSLAHKASPGNALVSASSKKLLDPFLEFEKVELVVGSNEQTELETFKLVGEREAEALSSLRPWSATREMIGRDKEKAKLLKLWSLTNNKGNAVLINGQAGIGKSKLTYEVKKEISSLGGKVRECRCLPEYKNNALYPFLNMLRNHWGIVGIDDEERVVKKLREVLKNAECNKKDSLPLICSWLSIPLSEEYTLISTTPEDQKALFFQIMKQCILHISKDQKLLLVVEDLHWLDSTSIEFIEYLLSSIENHQLLLVMTTRPIFQNPWGNKLITIINLTILSKNAIQLLVEEILKGIPISNKVLGYIELRTDGVPLFIEELINMLLDQNYIKLEDKKYEIVANIDQIVPMTLQDLLNARLDRLGLAKETAQLAATIGREFGYELLLKSSAKDEATIQSDLNLLTNVDLIYLQRKVQGETYIFRHALIRDAAYEGMVTKQRKKNHAMIADTLNSEFPKIIEDTPLEIARHFAGAEKFEDATNVGIESIEKQIKNSLNIAALDINKLVVNWLCKIPDGDKKIELEFKLNNMILPAIMAQSGYGSKEVVAINKRNELLISKVKENENSISNKVLSEIAHQTEWGLFLGYHFGGKRKEAAILVNSMLNQLKKNPNRDIEVGISPLISQAFHADGDFKKASELCDRVIEIYNKDTDIEIGFKYCMEPKSAAYFLKTTIVLCEGKPAIAFELILKAINWAKEIKHSVTLTLAYTYYALLAYLVDDKMLLKSIIKEHDEINGDISEENWVRTHLDMLGYWALSEIQSGEKYVSNTLKSNQYYALSWYEPSLAKTYLEKGFTDKAINLLENSLKRCELDNEKWVLPHLRRNLAKCYYKKNRLETKKIKHLLTKAIIEAKDINALWFELEARVTWVELLGDDNETIKQKDKIEELISKIPGGERFKLIQQAITITKSNQLV
ncbi:TOMM system kinase/cyclase fusion protein, partial [Tenacibaculum sp.]|nr:TOMM system kinase/cyclase fusion protein [Tenacibaculum sp.]